MIVFLTAFCGLSLADVERMTFRGIVKYAEVYKEMMGFDRISDPREADNTGVKEKGGNTVSLDDPDAVCRALSEAGLLKKV